MMNYWEPYGNHMGTLKKKKEGKEFFLILHLALGITLIIIIMPHPL
jgi:hypothetical protein